MNTIALKGDFIRKEGEASSIITPGELVEWGGANDLQVHSTAAGAARKAFALENDLVGNGIDDDYAAGVTVQYGVFTSGAEVYAWLAGGENVAKGAAMASDGAGALQATGSPGADEYPVAFAAEAKDNSGGSDPVRIKVEVA